MFVLPAISLIAGVAQAAQVVLTGKPTIGNIAYSLPTDRTFLLNVPAGYIHGEPHPLVLSFHGGKLRSPSEEDNVTGTLVC